MLDRKHNVQLPDEYDQINRDLAPFRALHPSLIKSRLRRMQAEPDKFTISVENGRALSSHVTYDGGAILGSDDRRLGQVGLIEKVARWIPNFEAVYSIHDSPTRFISYSHKEELLDLAEDGECEFIVALVPFALWLSPSRWTDDHDDRDTRLRPKHTGADV